MDENIKEKGIAQLIAERQGTTPRGAFSENNSIQRSKEAIENTKTE